MVIVHSKYHEDEMFMNMEWKEHGTSWSNGRHGFYILLAPPLEPQLNQRLLHKAKASSWWLFLGDSECNGSDR
jgi:hypothetical protein